MSVVKNRAGRCAKLVVARVAIELCPIRNCRGGFVAAGASDATGPTESLDIAAAMFVITKFFNQVNEVHRLINHRKDSMPKAKKHPKDMNSEETLKHIFHPKIVKAVKAVVKKHNAKVGK